MIRNALFAAASAAALFDAANCVRLGHADWIFPAVTAVAFAALLPATPAAQKRRK